MSTDSRVQDGAFLEGLEGFVQPGKVTQVFVEIFWQDLGGDDMI